eukprot:4530502-Lingulodinium_polyedra.AAC.1
MPNLAGHAAVRPGQTSHMLVELANHKLLGALMGRLKLDATAGVDTPEHILLALAHDSDQAL